MARAQFCTQIFQNHVNDLQPLPKYNAGACAGFWKDGL